VSKSNVLFFAAACGVAFTLACTDDSAPGKADAGKGGQGGGGNTEDAPVALPPGFKLTWRIVEPSTAIGEETDPGLDVRKLAPVAGATVCVHERDDIPCVTTDARGTFVIGGFKSLEHVVLTCEKEGYVGTVRTIETASTDMDGIGNPVFMGKSGGTPPDVGVPIAGEGKGAVSIVIAGPLADGGIALTEGSRLTLSPPSGDGPFFATRSNVIVKSATTTRGGLSYYFNLDEGDYTLTVDDDAQDCSPISFPFGQYGLPVPPHGASFKVLKGHVSDQVAILCTQKSVITPEGDAGTRDGG
jgi:hypothetical protein